MVSGYTLYICTHKNKMNGNGFAVGCLFHQNSGGDAYVLYWKPKETNGI